MSVGETGQVRSQSTKAFPYPKRQRIELLGFTGRSRSFAGEVQLKCIWESFYGKFRAWEPLRTFLEGDPAVWSRFLKEDLTPQPTGNDLDGLPPEDESSDDGHDENAERRTDQGTLLRVERVIAYAELGNGTGVILCKWNGRSLGSSSWEPLENVLDKVSLYDQVEAARVEWSLRTGQQPSAPLFLSAPKPVKSRLRSIVPSLNLHATPTPQLLVPASSVQTTSSGNPFSPVGILVEQGAPQTRKPKHPMNISKLADAARNSKDLYARGPAESKVQSTAPLPPLPPSAPTPFASTAPAQSSSASILAAASFGKSQSVSRALELAEWFGEKGIDGTSGAHPVGDRAPPPASEALVAHDLMMIREKLKVLGNANHFDIAPSRIQTEVRLGLPEAAIRKKVVDSPRGARQNEVRESARTERFLLPQVTGGDDDEGERHRVKQKGENVLTKVKEPTDHPPPLPIMKEAGTAEPVSQPRVQTEESAVMVTEDALKNRLWTEFVANSKRMQARLGTRILNNKGLICVCDRAGSLYPIFREIFERPDCREWIPPDSKGVECSICGAFSHFPCFAKSLEWEFSSIAFKKKLRKPEEWVTPAFLKKWVKNFVCLVCAIAQGDPFFPVDDILQIDWLAPIHTGNFFKPEALAPRAPKSDIVLPVELDREDAHAIKNGLRCLQLRSFRLKADHSSSPKFPNDEVEIWFLQSREKTVEKLKKPPAFRIRQDFFRLLPASYACDITRPQSVKVIAEFESAYDGPYVVCLVKTRARLDFPEIFDALKRTAVVPYNTCHAFALNLLFPPDSEATAKNPSPSDDDDTDLSILSQDFRVKLTCPSTLVPIRTPARGFRCRHAQCFDLEFFLESAIHVHHFLRWQCPVCRLYCRPHELVIDSWMQSILANSQEKTEVSLDVLVDEARGTRTLYVPKSQTAQSVPVFSL